jgi:hypothetical protein
MATVRFLIVLSSALSQCAKLASLFREVTNAVDARCRHLLTLLNFDTLISP